MIRRPYLAMFLILPSATVVIFAMLIPLGYGLVMSLFDYKIGSETSATFVFLKNYVRFLQDPLAIKSLGITLPSPAWPCPLNSCSASVWRFFLRVSRNVGPES